MKQCDCYHTRKTHGYTYNQWTGAPISHYVEVGVCWGTRECDECSCGGDRTKCDFYDYVGEKAIAEHDTEIGCKYCNKIETINNFSGKQFFTLMPYHTDRAGGSMCIAINPCGDYVLHHEHEYDEVMHYADVRIKFCPFCGRDLPDRKEKKDE